MTGRSGEGASDSCGAVAVPCGRTPCAAARRRAGAPAAAGRGWVGVPRTVAYA